MKASRVLEQYQHMPSFSGIHTDCQSIVARLKADLKQRLDDPNVSELKIRLREARVTRRKIYVAQCVLLHSSFPLFLFHVGWLVYYRNDS